MAGEHLPTPRSLRAAAQTAAARGEPLVVMTSLAGCVYCDLVRNSHLVPMLRRGEVVAVRAFALAHAAPAAHFIVLTRECVEHRVEVGRDAQAAEGEGNAAGSGIGIVGRGIQCLRPV